MLLAQIVTEWIGNVTKKLYFSAYCNDYPIFTTARTITDLMNNVIEASNLYFEEEQIEIKHEDIKFENAT